MKIEITHYGHKASYEFDNEDVTLEDLIYHIEQLIRLTGYSINGTFEIVNEKE
jgi:transcriptional antiterminator